MSMEINLFQAGKGDCILVRCGMGVKKVNILIDSGLKRDYFLKALGRIAENDEKIDVLILTHDDNDHIKGASDLLRKLYREENNKKSAGISSFFDAGVPEKTYKNLFEGLTEDRVLFNFGGNGTETLLGVRDAKELFENFREMDIQNLKFVFSDMDEIPGVPYPNLLQLRWENAGQDIQSKVIRHPNQKELESEGERLEVVILSPGRQALVKYIQHAWEKLQEKDVLAKGGGKKPQSEWDRSVQYWLLNLENYANKSKTSYVNQASIAFLLIYEGRCGLFAGDASPEEMIKAGRKYLERKQIYQDYMEVDFIKLPHHGSSHNVNRAFFEFFRTKTFFVTTEGDVQYKHPGKVMLALIADSLKKGETADIYSSYSWWKNNVVFRKSEKYEGNWNEEGDLCILKDVDGNIKYLHFQKLGTEPVAIGKDIFVRR